MIDGALPGDSHSRIVEYLAAKGEDGPGIGGLAADVLRRIAADRSPQHASFQVAGVKCPKCHVEDVLLWKSFHRKWVCCVCRSCWHQFEIQIPRQPALNPQPGDRVLAVVPGGLRWGWCMAVDGDGCVALNLGLGRVVWVSREDVREVAEG